MIRKVLAVAVPTIGFAGALALRDLADPWIATAAVGVVAIGLAIWALGARVRPLFALRLWSMLGAIALGLALVVITHLLFAAVTHLSQPFAHEVVSLYGAIDVAYSQVVIVLLTLVVVLAEELVWRGVAMELAPGSRFQQAAASIALYALPQLLAGAWILALAAVFLGSVLAVERQLTGRLVEPFLTHAIWSVAIFVVAPLV